MTRTIGVALSIPAPYGGQLDEFRRAAGDPMAEFIPAHVTLLGPTPLADDEVPAAVEHLRVAATRHTSFDLHLRGSGTFRPITAVVFVAVATGISECEMLEKDIRTGPLDRERLYPYHPHVTVAHDLDDDTLDRVYAQLAHFEARFRVSGFTLFEHGVDGRWRPQQDFPFST
ncbi:2'-5' RNA ligase family protein [Cryptosporangium arvum]|uniref:2'-5' RNA ligase family protein n=1 Tax=Cryptosporangium arvum TaxID=80871 RepID=UPI0004B5F102|nr:2'-5' RNA ligase family protein [Cryptosporangium arvum]